MVHRPMALGPIREYLSFFFEPCPLIYRATTTIVMILAILARSRIKLQRTERPLLRQRQVPRSTTTTFRGLRDSGCRESSYLCLPLDPRPLTYIRDSRSACTCPGEDHPGPKTSKGRGAPEIDVLEAQKNKDGPGGRVTQSCQVAPFDQEYAYVNTTGAITVYDTTKTHQNTYRGSAK